MSKTSEIIPSTSMPSPLTLIQTQFDICSTVANFLVPDWCCSMWQAWQTDTVSKFPLKNSAFRYGYKKKLFYGFL